MSTYKEIRTSNWVVRLPGDWRRSLEQARGFQFESRDGSKGLYIATHIPAPEHPGSVKELAEWFVAAELATLREMQDYTWSIAEHSVLAAPGSCVAMLDCVALEQHYRVVAKILARPGQVVRASFHDYQCRHYDDSNAYFASIRASLAFVEPASHAPGAVLH